MATHLDLEEQEQLDQLKHFWAKYGNLITWLLIAVLASFAAWNGWQYWQRKTAVQAAALYDELERAADLGEVDRVKRVWSDIQANVARAAQAPQAGLLVAKVLYQADQQDGSKVALNWVIEHAGDEAIVAVARLRLAGLLFEANDLDAAQQALEVQLPAAFSGLAADRRGDILTAKGQPDAARAEYIKAYDALSSDQGYRRIIEAKLNALGVNPSSRANGQQEVSQ